MPSEQAAPQVVQEARLRLQKRLAIIASDMTDFIRLAAIKAVQASLDPRHSKRSANPYTLLNSVLPRWASRLYRHPGTGRVESMTVKTPPLSILDVWA